jgi:hypothetical protein
MLLAILFAYFGYKKASESGRNGILWAIIAVLVFLSSQFLLGLAAGITVLIGSISFGWSEKILDENGVILNLFGIAAGLGGGFLVLWYLGRPIRPIKEEESIEEPPPPPEFDGN